MDRQLFFKVLLSVLGMVLTYIAGPATRKNLRRPSIRFLLQMAKFLWMYQRLSRRWHRFLPPLRWSWMIATVVRVLRFRRRISSLEKAFQIF
jgi:hypothetical protein